MKIRLLVTYAILAICLPGPVLGQSTYGAVVGVAYDSTGAALPGATVTLTEVQTNFERTTDQPTARGRSSSRT